MPPKGRPLGMVFTAQGRWGRGGTGAGAPHPQPPCLVEAGEGLTHDRVGVGYRPWLWPWVCPSWGLAGLPPGLSRLPSQQEGVNKPVRLPVSCYC